MFCNFLEFSDFLLGAFCCLDLLGFLDLLNFLESQVLEYIYDCFLFFTIMQFELCKVNII